MKLLKALMAAMICFSLYVPATQADVKVGTVLFYPPFVMANGSGFDIQFIQALCQTIKEKCDLIPLDFNQLYTELDDGKIDLAIGGITISSEGSFKYIYSLPYVLSKGMFLILKNSHISSVKELQHTRVGVIEGERDGGVFYNFLTMNYPEEFRIVKFTRMDDLMTALVNGHISAAFCHESTVRYWQLNGGDQFKLLGTPMIVGDGIGIMASLQNHNLIDQVNIGIKKLEQKNYYLNLYTTYFSAEQ